MYVDDFTESLLSFIFRLKDRQHSTRGNGLPKPFVYFKLTQEHPQELSLCIRIPLIYDLKVGLVLKHCLPVDFSSVKTRVTRWTERDQVLKGVFSHLGPWRDVRKVDGGLSTRRDRAPMPSLDKYGPLQVRWDVRSAFSHAAEHRHHLGHHSS
nr:hypothetical protein [Streptomyces orinoci]